MSFARLPFLEAFSDVSGGNKKLPQSEFSKQGELPVIDQGQQLIGGYTNDDSFRFSSADLPVIVFGDHTKAMKFVDFPFAMGADGIKVLKPAPRLDAKFAYHFLCQAPIPDAGYSRHFKFLKEISVPAPPLSEQRRIAAILDKADDLRAKRRAALAELDGLAQSIFHAHFGDPIENPRGYPVKHLIDLVDSKRPISYGILMPGPDQEVGVKYVRVTDMKSGGVDLTGIRKTTYAISNSYRRSLLRAGDLLMSIRGHVGRFAVIPMDLDGANITQDSARLALREASTLFVRECLRSPGFQRWMEKRTKGVAVRGINLGDVKLMPVITPPREAQDAFASMVSAIDVSRLLHRKALADLDTLFASLQHRAFRGEL